MIRSVGLCLVAFAAACAEKPAPRVSIAPVAPMASVAPPHAALGAPQRSKLEILEVDDAIDPFAGMRADAIPEGSHVQIEEEDVPLAVGAHHFAQRSLAPGESKRAAAAAFRAWLKTIPLPAGARFGLKDVVDYDENTYESTVVALRTFVLVGDSVVGADDVADASVVVSPDGAYFVRVALSAGGARRVENLTREWMKRRLAIVLDGEIKIAPVVRGVISDGRVSISVGPDDPPTMLAKARALADALRPR